MNLRIARTSSRGVTPALGLLAFVLAMGFAASPLRAEGDWHPSKWGKDDTLGAINELSPEGVLRAVQLVKTGKTYSLGVETGRSTPAYGARSYQLFAVASGDGSGGSTGANEGTFNDDWMTTWLGIGTQIDGLGHFGIGHVYYNGNHVSDFWQPEGLTKFATHLLPPIVTRGVLLDIAALEGVPMLAGGKVIGSREIKAAAKRQSIELRRGDVVIFNTGWQALASSDPEKFLSTEPGLDVEGAEYLAEVGVVAVGADTWGLDALPNPDPKIVFPVHQVLLAKNGIYILENIRTDELVADSAWEFLFVLGHPKFVGAVLMVINPVAFR
jgi:kynurenine formamidase